MRPGNWLVLRVEMLILVPQYGKSLGLRMSRIGWTLLLLLEVVWLLLEW